MKTMPILIAMLLAGSAFALAPDDPAYKELDAAWKETVRTRPVEQTTQPSTTTILPTCGDQYSAITTYADGHKQISDILPMSGGQVGIISH